MLERRYGNYVKVDDLLVWLNNLTDDDNRIVMLHKIEQLQGELGDL